MNPLVFSSAKMALGLCAAIWLFACARQGSPTGGPKDTEPPVVDTALSTRNFATRFSERRIELVFNEWITLSDVGTQVIVSPTLPKRPEVTLKGRKVVVELPEEDTLRPNTTYTINFGTAVKDLHENNPADNLRFVFSTGDFLDSLTLSGSVVDAFSGEPVEKVSIMLYDNLSDSVVRKERPFYFSRVNKSGQFSLQNLRAGTFKIAAIEDASGDLKWDGQNERIGFPDSLLHLSDSGKVALTLKIFKNQPKLRLFDHKTLRYGLLKLAFTARPDTVSLRAEAPGLRRVTEINQDTLLVWYDMPEPAAWQLLAGSDTIPVKNLPRDEFLGKHKFSFADEAVSAGRAGNRREAAPAPGATLSVRTVSQSPLKPAVLTFNVPVASVDTSRWLFLLDSVRLTDFSTKPDSAAPRNLIVNTSWKFGKNYSLTLLPGAVTDFYGVANTDTLQRILNVATEKQFGGLTLTLTNLVPRTRYVLQLLNGTNVEEERAFDSELTEQKLAFTRLPATTYTARLTEDRNRNGRWDTGDYFAHRQPEPVFIKKLEPLRANWEVEATFAAELLASPVKPSDK